MKVNKYGPLPQTAKNTMGNTYPTDYFQRLSAALSEFDEPNLQILSDELSRVWQEGRSVWICGNGGSAANAIHWANDFLYPVAKKSQRGLKFHALSANSSVLTCLGNDISYDQIFARQLATYANEGDMLIVLSGSGNSPNILEALKTASRLAVTSFAIVGFDGGEAKKIANFSIHIKQNDMQIAEDIQMAICHCLLKKLAE